MICAELNSTAAPPRPRRTTVLRLVGIAPSSWHRGPRAAGRGAEASRPAPPAHCRRGHRSRGHDGDEESVVRL